MNRHDIHSKAQPGLLLHSVLFGTFEPGRQDVSRPSDPLQLALIYAEPGRVFKAHYHIPKAAPPQHVTQESWHIQEGVVFIRYFDVDGKYLEEVCLIAGDTSITFAGGHEYRAGKEGVKAKEYKTGPYHSQQLDKVWL